MRECTIGKWELYTWVWFCWRLGEGWFLHTEPQNSSILKVHVSGRALEDLVTANSSVVLNPLNFRPYMITLSMMQPWLFHLLNITPTKLSCHFDSHFYYLCHIRIYTYFRICICGTQSADTLYHYCYMKILKSHQNACSDIFHDHYILTTSETAPEGKDFI